MREYLWLFGAEEFIMSVLAVVVVTGLFATVEPEQFHAGYLWLLIVLPTVGYLSAMWRYQVRE